MWKPKNDSTPGNWFCKNGNLHSSTWSLFWRFSLDDLLECLVELYPHKSPYLCGSKCKSRCFKCDAGFFCFSKISGRLFTLTWPLKKNIISLESLLPFSKVMKITRWVADFFNVAWSFESHKRELAELGQTIAQCFENYLKSLILDHLYPFLLGLT